jgi:hypothetical protein
MEPILSHIGKFRMGKVLSKILLWVSTATNRHCKTDIYLNQALFRHYPLLKSSTRILPIKIGKMSSYMFPNSCSDTFNMAILPKNKNE